MSRAQPRSAPVLHSAAVLLAAVTLPLVDARTEAHAAGASVRTPTTTVEPAAAPRGGGLDASQTINAPATTTSIGGTTPEAPARVRASITRFQLSRSVWRAGAAAPQVRLRLDAARQTAATVQLRIEDRASHRLVAKQALGTVRSGVDVAQDVTKAIAAKPGRYRLRLVVTDATGKRARRAGAPALRNLRVREAQATATAPTPHAGATTVFPVQGRCNFRSLQAQRFQAGRGGGRRHNGQDIGTYDGSPPVVAFTAGVIERTWWDDAGGGWTLVLNGDDGIAYGYLHLQPGSTVVRAGQRVAAGQVLANAGHSGGDYEPHLHFEMRPQPWSANRDRAIDPYPVLVKLPNPCDG
jgi:murein DD-endopeptidase MepM/ murein hydrolase activator NlpD